ncbi:MAG: hypothetical protein ACI3XG_02445 [Faecousia sp.]
MKKEERILRALGNVKDGFVLEASQHVGNPRREVLVQPKKKKWPGFAAMAAAAALMLTGALSLYPLLNRQSGEVAQDTAPVASVQKWTSAGQPAFQIEYDRELLDMVEGIGGVFLYPIEYADDLPVSEIKIEFLPGLLPYAAMEKSKAELADDLTPIHQDQETGTYSFHIDIDHGDAWDSQAEDVLIVGAGSYGSYRLTSRYFVEATEGWGSTFARICASFNCPLEESPNPEAEKVIMDFAEGYFSGNQIVMLANYYGDSQDLREVYTQDASRVQIVSLQGLEELDNWIEKDGFAHVSLVFLETELDDSYTNLSMEVMKTQAGYRVSFYGLEK